MNEITVYLSLAGHTEVELKMNSGDSERFQNLLSLFQEARTYLGPIQTNNAVEVICPSEEIRLLFKKCFEENWNRM